MTSFTNQTPPKGTDSHIAWPPQQLQGLYTDWGKYCSRKRREIKAIDYFDRARALKSDDYKTLYHSSQSKRRAGKTEDALTDSRQAQKILDGLNTCKLPVNLEICDALFELNQFENAKSELHHNTRLFSGNRRRNFENRLTVVDKTLKDTCGNALSSFELENEKIFKHVKELQNAEKHVDDGPLWKKLREQNDCDVLSIPEIEEKRLSPLEIARRKRAFDVRNQVYMNRSGNDVLFLNELRKNPKLLLKQCSNKEHLKKLTANQYSTVEHFLSMLNARSPIYYARYIKQMSPGFKEANLYRIQYQTRRDMITILRTIKEYRIKKSLMKLGSYVEEVMGDYVVLKTHRIMPWKFEFMNDVYNTYALALSEQYYVPKNYRPSTLLVLLRHAVDKSKDPPNIVFGDRSTYLSLGTRDKKRDLLVRLENRLVFAKHSIEKCYLLHKIANIHLQAHRYDQCCFGARKAIDESKNCNSWLWNLLATILIIKSNATLGKIEATKLAIANALDFAEKLKCDRLVEFFQLCESYNNERISAKNSVQSGSKWNSNLSISSSNF